VLVKLSVVIITYNEEKNLERCLKSVVPVADEIVVVDSFSTDKTKEIALKYKAKFVEHAFEGHIEQKNWAITQASYKHVLSIDGDEALDETLINSINAIKVNWQADGYSMNRLTNYCGKWIKHSGWYPDKKLRLWNSEKGEWQGTNPHDEYRMQKGCTIKHIKGDILHYSYYSIHQHLEQVNYFTEIMAKQYLEKGRRASLFNLLMNPTLKFVGSYIFQKGFLDGIYGLAICIISAHATFLKYLKLYQLQKDAR
jgi:glycosyltransferase involved in cell wall biosynthesis